MISMLAKGLGKTDLKLNRLTLVTLKYKEDASITHNYGRGRKFTDCIWINPDLTKVERDALYIQRVQKQQNCKVNPTEKDADPERENILNTTQKPNHSSQTDAKNLWKKM